MALTIVVSAKSKVKSNCKASTSPVLNDLPSSSILIFLNLFLSCFIFLKALWSSASLLNIQTLSFMWRLISSLKKGTFSSPSHPKISSKTLFSSTRILSRGSPRKPCDKACLAASSPATAPKTRQSDVELVPSLFAPCTFKHAHSPAT